MSVEVKTPTRTQFEHTEFLCGDKQSNSKPKISPVSFKFENQHQFQRRQSDSGQNFSSQWKKRRLNSNRGDNSYHPPGSRRRRFKSTPNEQIVLPTKFLLGGNINDPLNLNSINEEENEKTPYTSPAPTPAHRKEPINSIPFNITDPLNLESADDEIGIRGTKKKKRNKRRHESFSFSHHPGPLSERKKSLMEALKIEIDEPSASDQNSSEMKSPQMQELAFKLDSSSKPDKIVSPVIPQSSPRPRKRKRCMSTSDIKPENSSSAARSVFRISLSPSRTLDSQKTPPAKLSKKQSHKNSGPVKINQNPKFVHGNYNRYYGYRNPEMEDDHRLQCFRKEWFENKDILDIGCNVGHLTLSIAKDFNPSKVVGVDIDRSLIAAARKNIRHYISTKTTDSSRFPVSNLINYGPISAPPVDENTSNQSFPYNITFTQGNYVLNSDELVDQQREEYDIILALSITKWIHLNKGDTGLKRFFRRIYNHLRPGGKLILEPQPWSSYKKKKKLTEEIYKCFQGIQLKPQQFRDYLLREVGFSTCEVVDVPFNKSKGFRRPIQVYTKTETAFNTPKDTPKSDFSTINTPLSVSEEGSSSLYTNTPTFICEHSLSPLHEDSNERINSGPNSVEDKGNEHLLEVNLHVDETQSVTITKSDSAEG